VSSYCLKVGFVRIVFGLGSSVFDLSSDVYGLDGLCYGLIVSALLCLVTSSCVVFYEFWNFFVM